MHKAAYANTPYRTPDSIRGPSLKQLHVQRKANEEMESLLASDSPVAGTKAFAKGLVAASMLPLVLQGLIPWARTAKGVHDKAVVQTNLASLMTAKGVPEAAAADQAASIYHYLDAQAKKPPQGLLDKLQSSMKTYQIHNPQSGATSLGQFVSKAEAETAARALLAKQNLPKDVLDKVVKRTVVELPLPRMGGGGPNAAHVESVLAEAARAFKESGKSRLPSLGKAHAKHLGMTVAKALPMAGMLGIPVGIGSYLMHRSKRNRLSDLRKQRAGINDQMLRRELRG